MGHDGAARLGGPAIRQHHQLRTVRAVYNLDNVGRVLSLGEAAYWLVLSMSAAILSHVPAILSSMMRCGLVIVDFAALRHSAACFLQAFAVRGLSDGSAVLLIAIGAHILSVHSWT